MRRIQRMPSRIAWGIAGLFLLAALCGGPSEGLAFGLSGVGGKLGVVDPDGADGTFAFGMNLEFEEAGSRFHLQPGFLYWNTNGLEDVNPNFDALYHFEPAGRLSPYLGAGVGLHVYSLDGPGADPGTDVGANLFGGVVFPAGSARIFAEGRYMATDLSQFGILGGVTFPFHE